MLKILNKQQIKEWDDATIRREPIASIALMEQACVAFVQWYVRKFPITQKIGIVCGTGNNGGDGMGIARLLSKRGYIVDVWVIAISAAESDNFVINRKRLPKKVGHFVLSATTGAAPFHTYQILIDAIFGSGLSRPVEGVYQQAIHAINRASAIRVAVDIPSGLFPDTHAVGTIIKANYTLTFGRPKLAFLLPENGPYVGVWVKADIGLSKKYLNEIEVSHFLITQKDAGKLLVARPQFTHKGDYGKALLIAGSYGKMGACTLAARAAIRSGVGVLTVHTPRRGYEIIQTTVPESMVSVDEDEKCFSSCPDVAHYTTLAVGPGLGQDRKTVHAMGELLGQMPQPIVIDADGLNIIANNRELLHLIPKQSILTPHPRELSRLIGKWDNDFDRMEKTQAFARQIEAIILIKGAYTAICAPNGAVYFNCTGNPGMATGGSGDVLTGLLAGLLAQPINPLNASILGVYIHGLAGDMAADKQGQNALIASDIIDFLPQAFKVLSENPCSNTPD